MRVLYHNKEEFGSNQYFGWIVGIVVIVVAAIVVMSIAAVVGCIHRMGRVIVG